MRNIVSVRANPEIVLNNWQLVPWELGKRCTWCIEFLFKLNKKYKRAFIILHPVQTGTNFKTIP